MRELRAKSVILACGGFEANPEWRTRYLGPSQDLAKVRGKPVQHWRRHPHGGLISGAVPRGNWSGCHAVQWEMNAPEFSQDLAVGDQFQKHSYPFCVLINATSKLISSTKAPTSRNYTYAKYGRVVVQEAAGTVCLADFRSEDQAFATRRISHPANHQR